MGSCGTWSDGVICHHIAPKLQMDLDQGVCEPLSTMAPWCFSGRENFGVCKIFITSDNSLLLTLKLANKQGLFSFCQKPDLKCADEKRVEGFESQPWGPCKCANSGFYPQLLLPLHLKGIPNPRQVLPVRVQLSANFWFQVKIFFFFASSIIQPWTVKRDPPPPERKPLVFTPQPSDESGEEAL